MHRKTKAKLTGLQIGSFQHVHVHTHGLSPLRRHLSVPSPHFCFHHEDCDVRCCKPVYSQKVHRQPSPGHKCFLILLGGSKHSLALPLSLALLGRKIFPRAGQHPGQRHAPCQCPRASPCTHCPFPQTPLQKQEQAQLRSFKCSSPTPRKRPTPHQDSPAPASPSSLPHLPLLQTGQFNA